MNAHDLLAAWLVAMIGLMTVPLGALALLLTWHLHRGRWGITLGPALTSAVGATPLVALGMLPVLLLAGALYPWAQSGMSHAWLAQPWFALRGLGYVAIWWLLAYLATRDGAPTVATPTRPALASAGLAAYALTTSLAGIDWVLSLQPAVFSSIFPMVFVAHLMLGGFAFLVLVGLPRGEAADARGIGVMLLGGLMLWLYLEYMQYLIAWSGDLPGHVEYYLARIGGPATGAIALLAVGCGAVPFVLLLSARLRGDRAVLRQLGLLFLIGRIVEAGWWVMPVVDGGPMLALLSALALLGSGGVGFAAWRHLARPWRQGLIHG